MITINFVFKFFILTSIFSFINIPIGICGSGGGSGKPMTPYKKDEIITEEKIIKIKNTNMPIRTALLPITADDSYNDKHLTGVGFIYLQNEKNLQYSEELGDLPEDFKFDNFGIDKISFDKNIQRLILNGLMSIQERNKFVNKLSSLTSDIAFRKKLRTAINKLFFLPRMKTDAFFFFDGYSESGKKQIVYLNEINLIKILEVDSEHGKLQLKIRKFPDITPNELISEKPTYSKLKESYTTELKIWVNSKNDKGEELYIAEIYHKDDSRMDFFYGLNIDWFNDKEYFVMDEKKIIEFQENDEIKLSYENKNIWWAIPSVTNDIEYPFRYQLAH